MYIYIFFNKKKKMITGVFKILSRTSFYRNIVFSIVVSLFSTILKIHVISLLSIFFSHSLYVDFFLQIVISISLNYIWLSPKISRCLKKSASAFGLRKKIDRFSKNITREKIICLKRASIILSSAYFIVILQFVDINSMLLTIYIIQNLFIVFIIEIIDDGYIPRIILAMKKKMFKHIPCCDPDRARTTIHSKPVIMENYISKPPSPKKTTVMVRNRKLRINKSFKLSKFLSYMYPMKK